MVNYQNAILAPGADKSGAVSGSVIVNLPAVIMTIDIDKILMAAAYYVRNCKILPESIPKALYLMAWLSRKFRS